MADRQRIHAARLERLRVQTEEMKLDPRHAAGPCLAPIKGPYGESRALASPVALLHRKPLAGCLVEFAFHDGRVSQLKTGGDASRLVVLPPVFVAAFPLFFFHLRSVK